MFLFFKNGKVKRYYSGGVRRFTTNIRSCSPERIDILVTYGKDYDVFGNYVLFTNQYIGSDKKEAIHAIKAFLE